MWQGTSELWIDKDVMNKSIYQFYSYYKYYIKLSLLNDMNHDHMFQLKLAIMKSIPNTINFSQNM